MTALLKCYAEAKRASVMKNMEPYTCIGLVNDADMLRSDDISILTARKDRCYQRLETHRVLRCSVQGRSRTTRTRPRLHTGVDSVVGEENSSAKRNSSGMSRTRMRILLIYVQLSETLN
jgi:hypothetical protein